MRTYSLPPAGSSSSVARRIRRGVGLVAVGLLTTMLPGVVVGQGGHHGNGLQDGHGLYFDPASVVKLTGVLTLSTGDWGPWGHGNHTGGGMGFGMRLADGEELELMLAPAWFLEDSGIILSSSEQITVTGSRVEAYDDGKHHGGGNGGGHGGGHGGMMGGDGEHDYLISTVIEADGVVLPVRDGDGYPLWRGGPGWGGHDWFDPSTLTTLTGTLAESQGLWSAWGHGNHTGNGMHYAFDADDGTSYYAMLGPWWYMADQGVTPEHGARVELRGSVVDAYWSRYADRKFIIASEFKVNGTSVQLRDEWGYPLWHGTGWFYDCPAWSAESVGEVAGTVKRVRRRSHGRFLDRGYEVVLRAGRRSYTLYVAPDWEVDRVGMRLRAGDEISVRGAIGKSGGRRHVVVGHIDSAGARWRFRTAAGVPRWIRGAR